MAHALRAALRHVARFAGDRVVLAVLAGTTLLGAWLLLAPSDADTRVRTYWAVQPLLDLLMGVLSHRAASTVAATGAPASTARFWRWMSRACGLFFVGDVLQTVETWRRVDPSTLAGSTTQLVFVASGMLGMVVVTLTHPLGLTGSQRRRSLIDTATIVAAAASVVWYLDPLASSTGPVLAGVLLIAVLGVARLALSANPPFTRAAAVVGVAGVSTTGLAQALPHGGAGDAYPGLAVLVGLLPSVVMALAPRMQELTLRDTAHRASRPPRPYSLLPYCGLAASLTVLVVAASHQAWATQLWGLLAGNVVVMALVVLRQLDAFRENAELLTRLDASLATLAQTEQRFRSLIQNSSDVTLIVDGDGTIRYASPALLGVLGVAPQAAVERLLHEVFEADGQPGDAAWQRLLVDITPGQTTRRLTVRHTDGSWRHLEVTVADLRGEPGVDGIVCNARDVTQAHELQLRLEHQATHDPLTSLPNRAAFDEHTRALAAEPGRVSVLLVDLNGFKPINDTYGHHAGDLVLIAAAERIAAAVRPGDVVARLGGDEFAVLLRRTTQGQAVAVARRVADLIEQPVHVADAVLQVSASIGIASGASAALEALLHAADAAMYVAKRDPGGPGYACAGVG